MGTPQDGYNGSEIAIVGMALRVPGANDLDQYWENVRDGIESVRELSEDELRLAGVSDADLRNPKYVRMAAPLSGAKEFDAALFGFSPRDAAIMDPQHRHFLEVSWEALEHAGYDPTRYDGAIGVFGGSGHNVYLSYNLLTNPDLMDSVGFFLVRHTSNDKDFLVTRVSYLFDLKGPAINVQTACSTSLVAVHMGVQSLLNGESDMILAGGVTIDMPLGRGYVHEEGEILSSDGHCRAFDAKSSGTVFGSGVGVVVLKRLEDALRDGDTVHAVIRGTAINNDGAGKVGYLAPSVDGQAAAVGEAIAVADVDPETIEYIECHGTGTEIGDPIEVAALTQAFRAHTDKSGFCAIGSVKANIGHLDTAAGVAGLIKTCLALEHRTIPATVHYEKPNPRIDFDGSPFFVSSETHAWSAAGHPRRAGVSSLGVGGTNAHVIVEEAPSSKPGSPSRPWQLLPLSAKGPSALDAATANLARFLSEDRDVDLADVAFTLQTGRRELDVRRFAVVRDTADAASVMGGDHPKRLVTGTAKVQDRSVVFMFPGQGAQFANMGRGLYQQEAVFRDCVDECADLLVPLLGCDLRSVLFPDPDDVDSANAQLGETAFTQPAIFTIEYAMAKLWMSWGVTPIAMIGHSIGEYTAACLAGVFSLPDALNVVASRGRLMQDLPGGSMLAIPASSTEVERHLRDGLALAARNGPEFCVVAGPDESVDALQAQLEGDEVAVRRLHTSHAFHSSMMDPILGSFADVVARTTRHEPQIPYVSNTTGDWITFEQIDDPGYWAGHVRGTVDFLGGLSTILARDADSALLEVGPGRTLATFARQVEGPHRQAISTSMRHANSDDDDLAVALTAMGELWTVGAVHDWGPLRGEEARRRVPLPTYPFQHEEYWVEPGEHVYSGGGAAGDLAKRPDLADWFYTPTWTPRRAPGSEHRDAESEADPSRWLVLLDDEGVGDRLAESLRADAEVITVTRDSEFARTGPGAFALDPSDPAHHRELVRELAAAGQLPTGVAYLWPVTSTETLDVASAQFGASTVDSFYGQLHLAQALAGEAVDDPIDWWVVTNHMQSVAGDQTIHPVQALAMGPVRVIGQEHPLIRCRNVDVEWPLRSIRQVDDLVDRLAAELRGGADDSVIAHRGHTRWVQDWTAAPIEEPSDHEHLIKEGGTYLITGGTAGVGFEVAEHLAHSARARLILVARTELPAPDEWDQCIHDEPDSALGSRLRRVRAMESAGAEVMVAAADVTDEAAMRTVVAAARERFGRIDGVFHAAGHLADGLISMKERSDAESVLAPKVTGTLVLENVLAGQDLDFLVLFSSISATTAIAGQIDYAAANAFLNSYARHRMGEDERVTVAIGWGPWNGVGMTVRTAVELGLIEDTDRLVAVDHPLLDRRYVNDDGDVFETQFSPERHWVLDEHRMRSGVSLMPGTGYLDLVTAAHSQSVADPIVEISDVFFMAPFTVEDGAVSIVRTTVANDGEFVISSNGGTVPHEHARGRIRGLAGDSPDRLDVREIGDRCTRRVVEFERNEHEQLRWGPRWNTLRRLAFGDREALASLAVPPPFVSDLEAHPLHPAVLDLATAGAQELIDGFTAGVDFYVPFSYGRLRQYGPLVEHVCSHIRYRPAHDPETAVFDISISDSDGVVLVDIEGFVMRRAVGEIAAAAAAEADEVPTDPLLDSLANGIAPSEGVQALRRVLSGRPVPEVTVSSRNLHALIRRAAETGSDAGAAGTGISHQRPDLSTPFVEPSSDRQRAVAAVWEEMLGIAGVGIHDDFFELGGHSLLLTQVITRIKRLATVEVSLFTLFEATTISEVVAEMDKAEDEQGADGAEAAPVLAPVSRDKYRTKLKTLQSQGTGGDR